MIINKQERWGCLKNLIITNNPLVQKKLDNVHFIDGSFEDVLIKVRDLVHSGYELISHPLGASIRMLFSPYRSVIVGEKQQAINIFQIEIIENSIISYKKHMEVRNLDNKNSDDYEMIDFDLLQSTLKDLS